RSGLPPEARDAGDTVGGVRLLLRRFPPCPIIARKAPPYPYTVQTNRLSTGARVACRCSVKMSALNCSVILSASVAFGFLLLFSSFPRVFKPVFPFGAA